jgi:hypothetical protein
MVGQIDFGKVLGVIGDPNFDATRLPGHDATWLKTSLGKPIRLGQASPKRE